MLDAIRSYFVTKGLVINDTAIPDPKKVIRINVNIFMASQDGSFRYQNDFSKEVNVTDTQATNQMFSDFQTFLTSIIAKILKYRWT